MKHLPPRLRWVARFCTCLMAVVLPAGAAYAQPFTNLGVALFCDSQPLELSEAGLIFLGACEHVTGRDLNGDGDMVDQVVHVLDIATGVVTNLRLAADSWGPALRAHGTLAAFLVREGSQNADLNGDGDMSEEVLHVFDATTRTVINLGMAVQDFGSPGSFAVGDGFVVFGVTEFSQGARDLNGDGDHFDKVVHIFEPGRGVSNPGLAVYDMVADDVAAFRVLEREEHRDLNGDGDADDVVVHVFDPSTRDIRSTGFASGTIGGGSGLDVSGSLVAFIVGERFQGRDMNGDGAENDEVPVVFDAADGSAVIAGPPNRVGLSVSRGSQIEFDGTLLAFAASEIDESRDLNGDGDVSDQVLHVFDAGTGTTINLGVCQEYVGWVWMAGAFVGAGIHESCQGHRDLNGDGDASDIVYYIASVADGVLLSLRNTGLAAAYPLGLNSRLAAFAVDEWAQGSTDLNGNGYAIDRVLHVLDLDTGTITNVGMASSQLMVSGGLVAFLVYEEGVDLNGDGDSTGGWRFDPPPDNVLHVFNADTGRVRNLRLAAGLLLDFDRDVLLFAVSETNQGNRDLNADGDTLDFVAYVGPISTSSLEIRIDIRPDDFPNSVNPRSQGRLPVAILTTSAAAGEGIDFDATTVDAASVALGSGAAAGNAVHVEDVDDDGDLDLFFQFEIGESSIVCGTETAVLTGLTLDGRFFEGSDSVRTVGCR